jgi:RNA polymerase sigma-70 factor (ECF subfamily)
MGDALIAAPERQATPVHDGELLRKIADGELASLGALYDAHVDQVRRFVGRMGVAPADIDDVVQATFLLVLSASHNFDGRASARAWLLGLAANAVRHHRRSLRRLTDRLIQFAREPRVHTAPSAEEALAATEAAFRAQRAIERLPHKKRAVFLLVAIEGVNCEQAAAALGIPLATVWTRLHHARRDLHRLLEEEHA